MLGAPRHEHQATKQPILIPAPARAAQLVAAPLLVVTVLFPLSCMHIHICRHITCERVVAQNTA